MLHYKKKYVYQLSKFCIGKVIIILLIFFQFSCKKDLPNDKPAGKIDYSFFIAGHTYGKPGVDNVGVHPPFKEKFDWIRENKYIRFGVFTGDIVIKGTETNWDEIDEDLLQLGKHVYFAVGNHDMSNRSLFESRYGPTYFSFSYNSDLFIILDPNIDRWNISGEQLEFLKNTLNNETENVDNIFVFFHQVLWWSPDNIYRNIAINSSAGRSDTINFWNEIEPLFRSLHNQVVMCAGDVGAFYTGQEFMYHQYDNITLIASGMGGEVRDNFVVINVHESKSLSYELIALNDSNMYSLGALEDYILK